MVEYRHAMIHRIIETFGCGEHASYLGFESISGSAFYSNDLSVLQPLCINNGFLLYVRESREIITSN